MIDTKNIKYFNLIQTDAETFNKEQELKKEEYIKIHGEEAYENILSSNKHNPLKSRKENTYALTEDEIKKLLEDGFVIKQPAEKISYLMGYAKLYSNDLPCLITIDSMLKIFSDNYKNYMEKTESTKMIPLLNNVCKTILDKIQNLDVTNFPKELLNIIENLELIVLTTYIILNLVNKPDENFSSFQYENTTKYSKEEFRKDIMDYCSNEYEENKKNNVVEYAAYLEEYLEDKEEEKKSKEKLDNKIKKFKEVNGENYEEYLLKVTDTKTKEKEALTIILGKNYDEYLIKREELIKKFEASDKTANSNIFTDEKMESHQFEKVLDIYNKVIKNKLTKNQFEILYKKYEILTKDEYQNFVKENCEDKLQRHIENFQRNIFYSEEQYEEKLKRKREKKLKSQYYFVYEEEEKDKEYKKISNFNTFYGISRIFNHSIKKTDVYKKYVESFKEKTCNIDIKIKFTNEKNIISLIKKIMDCQDVQINFNNYELKISGANFKPTSYYCESFKMEKYFMAFKLFSSIGFKFNETFDKTSILEDIIKTTVIISQLTNNKYVEEFCNFITNLICKSKSIYNCFTIPNFADFTDLSLLETWKYLKTNMDNILNEYQKKNTEYVFDIINIGMPVDSRLVMNLVDDKLVNDDGTMDTPKTPLISDILYVLFNNDVLCDLKNRKYKNYMDDMKKNMTFENTVYEQQLKLLFSMSIKDSRLNFPFNTDKWKEKEATTQLTGLVQVRHDNVLYLKKLSGICMLCEHPEVYVEPCLSSWKQFVVLIQYMRQINDDEMMQRFEETLNMLIEFLELQLDEKEINVELKNRVYGIAKEHFGSGAGFTGWYPKLFYDKDDAEKQKKEIMTLFSSQDDVRGPGKTISYGTGKINYVYTLVKTKQDEYKVFIGMISSVYEVITKCGVEYNDNEWKDEINNYSELKMEKK